MLDPEILKMTLGGLVLDVLVAQSQVKAKDREIAALKKAAAPPPSEATAFAQANTE